MVTLTQLREGIESRLYKAPADVHVGGLGARCQKIWLPLAHLLASIPDDGVEFGDERALRRKADALGYNICNRVVLQDLGLIKPAPSGRFVRTSYANSADYLVEPLTIR